MDQGQINAVAGVLAVLLGVILYNNVAAVRARRKTATAPSASPWVGRYVQFEGDVLGEVIAQEGDDLVLRKGATTLLVPRAQIRPQGLDLGLQGHFDLTAALAAGAAWAVRHGAGAA